MATTPTKESKTSKLHSFLCVFDYFHNVNVNMLVTQLCLTLCDPMGCSLPGSSVHGILQARILEWVAISSPGDLPNLGIDPGSPSLQADCLLSEPQQMACITSPGFCNLSGLEGPSCHSPCINPTNPTGPTPNATFSQKPFLMAPPPPPSRRNPFPAFLCPFLVPC